MEPNLYKIENYLPIFLKNFASQWGHLPQYGPFLKLTRWLFDGEEVKMNSFS